MLPGWLHFSGSALGPATPDEYQQAEAPSQSPAARILFLDDDPGRARLFLKRHPVAVWVQTAEECIMHLQEDWDEVHLDHDLGGEIFVDPNRDDCGMEVVRWLCTDSGRPRAGTWFFVHSHNSEAAGLMVRMLRQHAYQAIYRPFGVDVLHRVSSDEDTTGDGAELPAGPTGATGCAPPASAPGVRRWLGRWLLRYRR